MSDNEHDADGDSDDDDDLLGAQEGKGYGDDEGERDEALEDEQ